MKRIEVEGRIDVLCDLYIEYEKCIINGTQIRFIINFYL